MQNPTQDSTYHNNCYTSHGALAGMKQTVFKPYMKVNQIVNKTTYVENKLRIKTSIQFIFTHGNCSQGIGALYKAMNTATYWYTLNTLQFYHWYSNTSRSDNISHKNTIQVSEHKQSFILFTKQKSVLILIFKIR